MVMKKLLACILGLFFAELAAADVVVMRDGTVRYGTVVKHDDQVVRFRMEREGMVSVFDLPTPQVARIIITPGWSGMPPRITSAPAASAPDTGPALTEATEPAVETAPAVPPVPSDSAAELAAYQSRGFLWELAASSLGKGPDDLERLPAADRELWEQAVKADAAGNRAETLETLRGLEAAMHDLPAGPTRLDAIARRLRDENFGTWMARVHWDLMRGKYSTGQFDLHDVRDIERRALIGLLRQATTGALEPLKPHLPPVDDRTGVQEPFRVSQLQGISPDNALEVKDKTLFAAAVLLAQLKLEPDMPAIDRALLTGQLVNVNHVLTRARDLEPLAKAAKARAERERKIAEEKAKRDAAIAAQKARLPK
jgi:hypothetical protein